jgi:hypothetical protein
MITYHSHGTRTVTIRGTEVIKLISVLDYNQSRKGVDLKDQLLHSYLNDRKQMYKLYMKLFHRPLNGSILNVIIIYGNNTRKKKTDQLSLRIQLVEGLFVKYAYVVQCKVLARHSSNDTVPCLTEGHFITKLPPTEKKSRPERWCLVSEVWDDA